VSYQAMEAVLQHSVAEGAARLVLLSIASHANDKGAQAYPGVKRLCAQTRLSERSVKYALKDLLNSGEIEIEAIGGGNVASGYRLTLPIEGKAKKEAKRDKYTPIPVQPLHPSSANSAPLQTLHPCKTEQAGVQNTTEGGAKHDIAYKEEPELEPVKRTGGKREARKRAEHPPSVEVVRLVMNRFPDKALWTRITQTLGENPDEQLLRDCWTEWVARGYSKINFAWLFDWYPNGIPANRNGTQARSSNNWQQSKTAGNEAAAEEAIRRMEARLNASGTDETVYQIANRTS
jgi:hypothetical protein